MNQLDAQFEGLAIGLEQRGEKSAAHIVRLKMAEIERLRAALRRATDYIGMDDPATAADIEATVNEQNAVKSGE